MLRAANKKNEKGNIPHPTVDNHDAFTFPIFFVLFLYFSPSINHAGPIIVFASSICFLAACIFPLFLDTLPTIQHHLPVNSSLTHFISIFYFTCIFQIYLVFDHKKVNFYFLLLSRLRFIFLNWFLFLQYFSIFVYLHLCSVVCKLNLWSLWPQFNNSTFDI